MKGVFLIMCLALGLLKAEEPTQCQLEESECLEKCVYKQHNERKVCFEQCEFNRNECDQDPDDTDEDVELKEEE